MFEVIQLVLCVLVCKKETGHHLIDQSILYDETLYIQRRFA
jgi:hypothetical protein